MNTKFLLAMGTVSALVFWIGGTIAGFIHGGYNPVRDTVSELGAIWAKSHVFMTVVMYISGIAGMLFVIGAVKACRLIGINYVPVITAVYIPFTTIWAAVFPMGTEEHAMTGMVVFIIYIGVILSLFLWRGDRLKTLRIWSAVSLVLLLGIFLRFTPVFPGREGLLQRSAHLGWSVWFIAINIQFVKLLNLKSLATSH
jgi:hypothetical protein